MPDRDLEPNNPLGPYYPSEVPSVPGSGRSWFAVLLVLVMVSSGLYAVVSFLLGL